MLCIYPLWASVNFSHYFNWTRFLVCYRINYQTHFLLFLEMSPYPIFIQFSSSLSCNSVQSYKLLGKERTGTLELCNTFWMLLFNTFCMAAEFRAALWQKSRTENQTRLLQIIFLFLKKSHYMITVMLKCSLIQYWAVLPSLPLTSKWISSAWVFENSLLWRHILAGQHKHYS